MDERHRKLSIYTVQISPTAYSVYVVISKKQFLSNFFSILCLVDMEFRNCFIYFRIQWKIDKLDLRLTIIEQNKLNSVFSIWKLCWKLLSKSKTEQC